MQIETEKKICFVILHYITYKDTIECVNSIMDNLNYENKQVVVVDNGSKNNSYEILQAEFKQDKNIFVIKSEENRGFARGNNLGFEYAKHELKADFIVILNNDTIVTQKDFCQLILSKYEKYHFSVLGPDIITLDQEHQNPWYRNGITLAECKKIRRNQYIHLILTFIGIDNFFSSRITHDSQTTVKGDILDVALHGACLIFSPDYIERFDGLDGRTFLYFEEDILKLYADRYSFLMMYSSDLFINHKEDVSSSAMHKSARKKRMFQYKERIKSSRVFEKIWNELKPERDV